MLKKSKAPIMILAQNKAINCDFYMCFAVYIGILNYICPTIL